MDDKLLAFELLDTFAENLKGLFAPYVDACLDVFLRDLPITSYEHDDVRTGAAKLVFFSFRLC